MPILKGYVGDQFPTPLASDVDNPSVPNLRPIYIFGRDMILDNLGRDGFVLFRSDEVDGADLPAYPSPISREIRDNTRMYPQIPIEWGNLMRFETQPSPANQIPRKLAERAGCRIYLCSGRRLFFQLCHPSGSPALWRPCGTQRHQQLHRRFHTSWSVPHPGWMRRNRPTLRHGICSVTNRVVLEDPFLDNLESQWARSTGRR